MFYYIPEQVLRCRSQHNDHADVFNKWTLHRIKNFIAQHFFFCTYEDLKFLRRGVEDCKFSFSFGFFSGTSGKVYGQSNENK